MSAYLGHVQRAMLTRLAAADQTTADLADIASRSVVGTSLSRLAVKGFARVTGTIPPDERGGRPREVWSITREGRAAHAAGKARTP